MLRRLVMGVLLIAGCKSVPAGTPAASGRPRLVLLIVIDQLPSWSFGAREHLLHRGLGRLLHEGAYFPRARYPYATTYTAPGHAAIGTGAPPAVTGIIANEYWDREEHGVTECVTDVGYPMLVVGGWPGELATNRPRSSPSRLRVDGLGDALHAATSGRGKAVGVSMKSRAAMLPLGRHGDLALWYDDVQRAFTTSTWYRTRAPAWLQALAYEHPIGPRLVDPWEPLDAALLAREAGVPDDAPGEAVNTPFGATFPHLPLVLADPGQAIKMMPLGNTVVREAALAAADGEELGRDDVPDLLVVSFSATDYVGHEYGQESWESLDMLLRLDAEVGQLIDGLERRVGKGRLAVVLSSDHGASRMIEQSHTGVRIDVEDVRAAAERAVTAEAGEAGPWLDAWREPYLFFNKRFAALSPPLRERALEAAAAAVRKVPAIGYAFRTDRVAGGCDARDPLEATVCRSVDTERSGDILFGPAAGSMVLDKEKDPIAHGSPNDDDTTVPVIVWGAGIAPARHDDVVSALGVAATVAQLLGVPPPTHAAPHLPLPI